MKPLPQDSQMNPPAGEAAAASVRPGRPLKYRHLIEALDDETIYSPGSIVQNGEEKDLLTTPEEKNNQRIRIRHTLASYAKNHDFCRPGEGWVNLKGLAAAEGWCGATWKAALPPKPPQLMSDN